MMNQTMTLKNKEAVISIKDLTKKFGDFTAVDHITLQVRRGEIFGFLGANGAGKTTAMRMLCGLSYPTSGNGTVAGYDILSQAEEIKRHIGYMSQKFSLYENLTVWENLKLFATIYGMSSSQIKEKTDAAFRALGMENMRNVMVKEIPLGWKQKLAFTAATLHEPDIVFLDEPTGGVDPATRRKFWEMIYRASSDRLRDHSLPGRGGILPPHLHHGGRAHQGVGQPGKAETAIPGRDDGRGVQNRSPGCPKRRRLISGRIKHSE